MGAGRGSGGPLDWGQAAETAASRIAAASGGARQDGCFIPGASRGIAGAFRKRCVAYQAFRPPSTTQAPEPFGRSEARAFGDSPFPGAGRTSEPPNIQTLQPPYS